MRIIKALLSSLIILFFLLSVSISQTSCSKTVTEHDTTIKSSRYHYQNRERYDIDTLYNLNYGLVAYYNFNNGNLNDSSGKGNNITFNNAVVTSDRFGRAGNAYQFSGGAYMQVPNSCVIEPITNYLMAIVKFNGYYTGYAWGK